MNKHKLYRIRFINHGNIYEMYARKVRQSDLFGFIEIGEFVFGETGAMVVDPSEERLKNEFEGVKDCHIPMHAILRIDEVEKKGIARITETKEKGSNITVFPSPIYTPTRER